MTSFIDDPENRITARFNAVLPHIYHASAMFYYIDGTHWREMIHNLKYHSMPHVGYTLGKMLGERLKRSGNYDEIDLITTVPIHYRRKFWRGYNQSDYIARGVSDVLGVPFKSGLIRRHHHNKSQVRMSRVDRWTNADGIFKVSCGKEFRERNLLLIDDVITTGATTLSCAEAIIDAAPSCRIWVSALAVSENEFGSEPMRK